MMYAVRNECIGGAGLPEVTVTPFSQSVEVTHTAMFTATVSGVGVENFVYQWRHNGTIIIGETGDTLMITNVMESDSGDYECIVSNQYGDSNQSDVAVLVVTSELCIVQFMLISVIIRNTTCYYFTANGHNNYFSK